MKLNLITLSAVALLLITGCTYNNPSMSEWDYKMYNEGWQLEEHGCHYTKPE